MLTARHSTRFEGTRGRVLIVDDEPLIRWSLSEALSDYGYVVSEAGTARAAIDETVATDDPFAVIVLDLRLPDSDNLSLLTKLRTLTPGTRIIIMSAHGTEEVAQQARRLGAFEYVDKPFEMAAMASLVGEASRTATA